MCLVVAPVPTITVEASFIGATVDISSVREISTHIYALISLRNNDRHDHQMHR